MKQLNGERQWFDMNVNMNVNMNVERQRKSFGDG